MLGEDKESSSARFSPNAHLAFFVFSFWPVVLGMIIIFPLIPIPIFLWWYSGAFLRKFKFELRQGYFFSRKGVFKASYTTIPYERIQDIHVTQSVLENLFGVWRVLIYTATARGRGAENIPCLRKEEAEALKSSLFGNIRKVREVVD